MDLENECCECKCGCKITPVIIIAFLIGVIAGFMFAPIKKGFSPRITFFSNNKGNGSHNGSNNGSEFGKIKENK